MNGAMVRGFVVRFKRQILMFSALVAVLLGSIAVLQPANAAVQSPAAIQDRCDRVVCMQIWRNGNRITTVEVWLLSNTNPLEVVIHYTGQKANGIHTGPQKSVRKECGATTCVAKWNINFTYKKGNLIYGWITLSGTVEGVPSWKI